MTPARPPDDAPPGDPVAPPSAPDATPAPRAAPAVVAVVVTHDPGPWFEETLESLAAQTYGSLSVLVVDADSTDDPTPRVAAVLPRARVRRLDHNPGYGAATNEVLGAVEGAAFYLLCHDDVALDPDAVQTLVEEAFRTNAGILGPKVLDWDDPRRILSVGGSIDKTGVRAPFSEPGELDQEQHDAVRDVFYVPTAAVLVRADMFRTIGGFDAAMTVLGDDVDLCWRAHVAGARVVVVPDATARHRQALPERRGDTDRRRLQNRHRVRTMLSTYSLGHLVRVVPQAIVLAVAECVVALLSGRFRHAADIAAAWTWNLAHLPSILRRRKEISRTRTVPDGEVRELQVRGSARLSAFLRGQVGPTDDRLGGLAATGRDLSSALRAPLTRAAVVAAAIAVVLMVVGSRNLVVGPLPAIGELTAFPSSAVDLLRTHLTGWRTTLGGGPGASPTGVGGAGLVSLVALGSTSVARKVLVLALLPAGPVGIWRLTRPIGSVRAAAAAITVYATVPVPYNALGRGSWTALAAYAAVPWIVLGLARATELAPFGGRGLAASATAEPVETSHAGVPARALGIGLSVALAAVVSPVLIPLAGLVAVGLLVGSLVAGKVEGLVRLAVAALVGGVVAIVLHLPWSAAVVGGGVGWSGVVGRSETPSGSVAELLRLHTGPVGDTPLAFAFLVAAALPLVIGRGWRLAWAIRAWFVGVAGWAVLVAGQQGWTSIPLPATEVLLVLPAVGLAFSTALGMAAFEVDLRHFRFGWRQAVSVAAAVAVVLGAVTLLPSALDGRWDVPRSDLDRALEPVLTADGDPDARVLWLGDPFVLPVTGERYDDDVSLATTDGLPDLTEHWAATNHPSTDRLVDAVGLAASRRTTRLGHLLGPEGVRYVVVPVRTLPSAYAGEERPPPAWLPDALTAQLDLEQVDTDSALMVFRNTAWRGMVTSIPDGTELPATPEGAVGVSRDGWEAIDDGTDPGRLRFDAPSGGGLVAAVPDDGWSLEPAEGGDDTDEAFGWALHAPEVSEGEGTLSYATSPAHVAGVLVQPVLWIVVLLVRNRLGRRRR